MPEQNTTTEPPAQTTNCGGCTHLATVHHVRCGITGCECRTAEFPRKQDALVAELCDALAKCVEAFRLTREYVGEDLLPNGEGWSHYDAIVAARAALAKAGR